MSVGQVVGVLVALVVVGWLVRWVQMKRKRWGRPLSSRNVKTWSKSDKWQPWR
jgi:hypothetical protein